MAEEGKISFGFKRLSKPTKLAFTIPLKQEENIQIIDCIDENLIKIKEYDSKIKTPVALLVVPLSTSSPHAKGSKLRNIIGCSSTTSANNQQDVKSDAVEAKDINSIAIKEILEDAEKSKQSKEVKSNFSLDLPLPGQEQNIDKESTLEDYETMPVSDYGLAMLRGMGWSATKGIGKTEKVVAAFEPKVRPRGMGLGNSLEGPKKPSNGVKIPSAPEEELKIIKGAYVQVTSGSKKGYYGQIEGFNEETGRLILKMVLGDSSVSVSEYMVKPVTKDEFQKNSRVLNTTKYNEYKEKETRHKENGSSKFPHKSKDRKKGYSSTTSHRDRSRSPRRR